MNALAQVTIPNVFPPAKTFTSFGGLISTILPNVYILAGVLLLILLIVGGFGVMMGTDQGDPRKTRDGTGAVTAAIIGFLIIFTSYWIIQIIEQVTGLKIFNSPY